jgi:Tetracyclin repressor-like, C-terminal domain
LLGDTHAWLREAGFSFRDAVHAYSVLDSYTYGFALQEKTIPFGTPEESAEMAASTVGDMGAAYPYLAEVVGEFSRSGYDYTEEFEFGLDLILDGLERFLPGSRPRSQRS